MLRLSLNGQLATEGMIESLGNPAERLQWLAHEVGGLEGGQVVFLGSPAASIPAKAGVMEVIDAFGSSMVVKLMG